MDTITIKLPTDPAAKCSKDTASGQYQVFPYITTADPTSLRYTSGQLTAPAPASVLPWFTDTTGNNTLSQYFTLPVTASVNDPGNLSWAVYQTASQWNIPGGLEPGTYNVGVMCIDLGPLNPSGAPDIPHNGDTTQDGQEHFWNTQFTFTAKGANDFTWTAVTSAGGGTTTTTTTTTPHTSTTTSSTSTTAPGSTTTVPGGTTSTTTSSTDTTIPLAGAAGGGSSGGGGTSGSGGGTSGSGGGTSGSGGSSSPDPASSQLAATGDGAWLHQAVVGGGLIFLGLFALSFAYPRRRLRLPPQPR